jgi:large subunit ribosomal protein L15
MSDNEEYQGLHNLIAVRGARKKFKRVGRGESSGIGKTCGRGMKGQKARKSGGVRPGFEGGQLPLARRQPKRGFKNYPFRKEFVVVNIGLLSERFEAGATVDPAALVAVGLVAKPTDSVKILGQGELSHALTIKAHKVSGSARAKVEAAGGSVELIAPRAKYVREKKAKKGAEAPAEA